MPICRADGRTQPMSSSEFEKYEIGGAYHWKWYLVNFEGYRDFVDRIVAELPPSGRVLDVGCGDGLMSYVFFRRGLDAVGVDDDAHAIALARTVCFDLARRTHFEAALRLGPVDGASVAERLARGALSFDCRSGYDVDPLGIFDVAVCAEVIEHVAEPERLVRALHRVVRDFAVITTPDGTGQDLGPYDHRLWTPDSFARFFAGYRIEHLDLRAGTLAVKLFKD